MAINLTAVDATAPTYVTVWPGGTARPMASNLNPVPGMAVPNLVITQLGPAGSIGLFNNSGALHLIGDLVGYFVSSSNLRLKPLTPARLLDTRDGTGGVLGALGPGQSVNLKVTGVGEVPTNAKAVALNVTVTEPTDGSFLTVWPAGDARPNASSVNMVPGQTVPNMVLARVGTDGKISIYNNTGSTHVVVDVIGAFADNATGRFVAIQPGRVLDTRDGTGVAPGRVAQTPVVLKLTGAKGVPTTGVERGADERRGGDAGVRHVRHRVPVGRRAAAGVEPERRGRPGGAEHGARPARCRRLRSALQQRRRHRPRRRRDGLLHHLTRVSGARR